jgi:biogenesis of lysosome-related organelles complex 1 subunit 2
MAEINERSSTSEYPASPTSSVSDEVRKMSENVFEKVSAFVQGHIQGTVDDYKLLEDMNNVTAQRYSDMKQVAETVSDRLSQLNEKYETFRPYLQQIDQIDETSKRMETAMTTLENYLTSIESRLRRMQHNSS